MKPKLCGICFITACKGVKYHCIFCNKKMTKPAKYCSKHCRVTDTESIKTLIASLKTCVPPKRKGLRK